MLGTAKFVSLIFYASPEFDFLIIVNTVAIPKYDNYLSTGKNFPFEMNIDREYFLGFFLRFDLCKNGEIFRKQINR